MQIFVLFKFELVGRKLFGKSLQFELGVGLIENANGAFQANFPQ